MSQTIGLIGAGSMGGPIGANLLAHGHVLVVHDIDAAAVRRLTAAGARSVASPREVAASASEVLVCLPSLEAIRTVTLGPQGLLEGTTLKTFVNFSTTGPAFVREIAAALARSKVTMLDCPITGGAARAAEGTLSITVSGDESHYRRVKPVLDAIASDIFYVGAEAGQAQLMKLLNNMLSFAAFVASCEAFAMGAKAGLDADAMVEVINTGTGRNSATTDKFPKNILPRTFDYGAKLAISFKDISLFLEEAERLGVPLWLAPVVKQVIGYAITQDGDANDVTTLMKHYEKWCGVEVLGKAAQTRGQRT
jgi:3-hydroxyisobutyrate dehydrogenase-like beta-hydroxyacid dehydrogenase